MIILIVCLIVGLVLAFWFAMAVLPLMIWAERRFRKDAYRLLGQANPGVKQVDRTIQGFSGFRDEESRELVRRLMDAKVSKGT